MVCAVIELFFLSGQTQPDGGSRLREMWVMFYEYTRLNIPEDNLQRRYNCFTSLALFRYTGEHKVFPLLQTFITGKLRGIQTYFFYHYLR